MIFSLFFVSGSDGLQPNSDGLPPLAMTMKQLRLRSSDGSFKFAAACGSFRRPFSTPFPKGFEEQRLKGS